MDQKMSSNSMYVPEKDFAVWELVLEYFQRTLMFQAHKQLKIAVDAICNFKLTAEGWEFIMNELLDCRDEHELGFLFEMELIKSIGKIMQCKNQLGSHSSEKESSSDMKSPPEKESSLDTKSLPEKESSSDTKSPPEKESSSATKSLPEKDESYDIILNQKLIDCLLRKIESCKSAVDNRQYIATIQKIRSYELHQSNLQRAIDLLQTKTNEINSKSISLGYITNHIQLLQKLTDDLMKF